MAKVVETGNDAAYIQLPLVVMQFDAVAGAAVVEQEGEYAVGGASSKGVSRKADGVVVGELGAGRDGAVGGVDAVQGAADAGRANSLAADEDIAGEVVDGRRQRCPEVDTTVAGKPP